MIVLEPSRPRSSSPASHHLHSLPPTAEKKWGGLKGFVWGTDDRNYRECPDDGALTGLLFGPLLSASLLLTTLQQKKVPSLESALPKGWLVESPLVLPSSTLETDRTAATLDAILKSRRSMLSLSTVVTLVLLFQLLLSRRAEMSAIFSTDPPLPPTTPGKMSKAHHTRVTDKEKERGRWVPKSEWRRTAWVVGLSFAATIVLGCLKVAFGYWNSPLWRGSFPS